MFHQPHLVDFSPSALFQLPRNCTISPSPGQHVSPCAIALVETVQCWIGAFVTLRMSDQNSPFRSRVFLEFSPALENTRTSLMCDTFSRGKFALSRCVLSEAISPVRLFSRGNCWAVFCAVFGRKENWWDAWSVIKKPVRQFF